MSLTKCPVCSKLCFTDIASCACCGEVFQPDALRVKAEAEDFRFKRKSSLLFLIIMLTVMGLQVFVLLQNYWTATGLFHS